MLFLVDTSAWVRFLQGREPIFSEVDRLLSLDAVLGHELVFGELLIGDPGGRLSLLSRYRLLTWSRTCPHDQVVSLVQRHRLHGRGIGWIDVHLLASSLRDDIEILTADVRLSEIAKELRLGSL